jgi:hypothetical protein
MQCTTFAYIVSKVCSKNRIKKYQSNDEIQALLQVMKSTEAANTYVHFMPARSRGGLVCPCDDLIHIVLGYRTFICNSVLDSPVLNWLWENIVLSSIGLTVQLQLQNCAWKILLKLYLKVRSFFICESINHMYETNNSSWTPCCFDNVVSTRHAWDTIIICNTVGYYCISCCISKSWMWVKYILHVQTNNTFNQC